MLIFVLETQKLVGTTITFEAQEEARFLMFRLWY